MFLPEFYRALALQYQRSQVFKGIDVYEFGISTDELQNSSVVATNAQYFQYFFSGIFNLTNAMSGIPVFVTKPHMVDVSPLVTRTTVPIYQRSCQRDFGVIVYVEPRSGYCMNQTIQSQYNLFISPLPGMPTANGNLSTWFQLIEQSYVPIFWRSQQSEMSDSDADEFQNDLYGTQWIAKITLWSCAVVASICLLFAVIFLGWSYYHYEKMMDEEEQLTESTSLKSNHRRSDSTASTQSFDSLLPHVNSSLAPIDVSYTNALHK